jgi:hypothetical protein
LSFAEIPLNRSSQCPQRFFTIEELDVFGLGNRESANCPGEMYEVRLVWWYSRMHTAFLREVVPFACIAGAAGGHHVLPVVVSAAGERDQVIPGQALPMAQIRLTAMTVLATVTVSSKKECIGDLTTETAGNVDELDESNDCRFGKNQSFASDNVAVIRFDDLGFALDNQPESTPHRDHGKRFKGGVQRQTPHATSPNVVNEAVPIPLRMPRIF